MVDDNTVKAVNIEEVRLSNCHADVAVYITSSVAVCPICVGKSRAPRAIDSAGRHGPLLLAVERGRRPAEAGLMDRPALMTSREDARSVLTHHSLV